MTTPAPTPDPWTEYRNALSALEAAAARVEAAVRAEVGVVGAAAGVCRPPPFTEAREWIDDMDRARRPMRPGDTMVLQGARDGVRVTLKRVDRRWVHDTAGQRYCRYTGMQRDSVGSMLSLVDRARVSRSFGPTGTPR